MAEKQAKGFINTNNIVNIDMDINDTVLLKAIDENQINYDLFLCRCDFLEIRQDDDFISVTTTKSPKVLNSVIQSQIRGLDFKESVQVKIREMEELQVPYEWKIWHTTHPRELGDYLEQKGFKKSPARPCMAIKIEEFFFDKTSNKEESLVKVQDSESQTKWIDLLMKNFELSGDRADIYREIFQHPSNNDNVHNYLFNCDGHSIGTATLFFHSGVAGVYWLSIDSQYRGQGFGERLLLSLLKKVLLNNHRVAILQSSSMGYGLYEKVGFKKISNCYLYKKEAEVMNKREVLRTFILENIDASELESSLKDSDKFFEIGLVDSLFAVKMLRFIESTFQRKVSPDEMKMENFESIDKICAFLAQKIAS